MTEGTSYARILLEAGVHAAGDLAEAATRVVRAGEEAWPDLALARTTFVRHLARHAARADATYLERVHAADLFLACACAERTPGAVQGFDRSVLAMMPSLLARMRPSDAFADDVRQELCERLLLRAEGGASAKIAEYSGRGTLVAWVRVAAVRTALNLRRGKDEQAGAARIEDCDLASPGLDPELDYLKVRYAKEFKEAFEQAVLTLSPEHRLALRLHSVEALRGDQIAAALRVDRSTAMRWLNQAREQLFAETRRALTARLRVDAREFESLVALVQSRLELSLSRLLRDKSG